MAIDWTKLGQATPTPTPRPTPVRPPPPPPGAGPVVSKAETPGMFNINVTPGGAAAALESNVAASGDLLDQINEQLFGQKGLGQITNQLNFGNPVTDTIGNVSGLIGKGVKAGLAGVVSPVSAVVGLPLGWLPGGADENFRDLRSDAIARGVWSDQDEQGWQVVEKAASDKGWDGGGNLKYNYLQDFSRAQNEPDMFPMLSKGPAASLGGVLVQAFAGGFQVPQSLVGRGIAGSEVGQAIFEQVGGRLLPGLIQPSGPGDRIDETLIRSQVAPESLNEAEAVVVQRLADESWTRDQALDFMTGRMTELSHDEVTQIFGQAITDPLVLASVGSAVIAKIGVRGAQVVEAVTGAGRVGGKLTAAQKIAVSAAKLTPSERFSVGLNGLAVGGLGRAAKGVRTIVDPLSAIGGNHSITQGAVSLLSSEGARAVVKPYGQGAVNSVFRTASELGFDIQPALQTYTGNLLRGYAAVKQRAALLSVNRIESLLNTVPGGGTDIVVGGRTGFDDVVDYSDSVRKTVFTADDNIQLSNRMAEAGFGARTPKEWAFAISKMSDGEKGFWHALSYGGPDNALQIVKRDALAAGSATGRVDPGEVVLLNDRVVDNIVVDDLAKAIGSAKTTMKKSALIEAAIERFPELRMIGDVPHTKGGVDAWVEYLLKRLEAKAFHSRVTPSELTSMGPEFEAFAVKYPSWNLGFAPDDAVKWGFNYDVKGEVVLTHTPHVGHVSQAAATFRPTADMARNVLGQVIGPRAGKLAGKLLDPIEIYSRTAAAQVSGIRIVRNIEQRFTKLAVTQHGMTEAESRKMFTAIKDKAFDLKVTLQGTTPVNIWDVAKDVVPQRLLGKLGRREVFNMVMVAAEGDLRVVGITSKMTNRVRSGLVTSGLIPGNMMGQISVSAYNMLRYTLNPVFIIQRVTDMSFFQILRGVPLETEAIRDQTLRVVRNMVNTSRMRDFALENIEYRQHGDFATILVNKLAPSRSLAEKVERLESRIIQAGQLDYIYSNMGALVRESLDELKRLDPGVTLPDTFAQLRQRYSAQLGRALNDNETGLEYLKEQFWAGSHGPDSIGDLVREGERIIPGDIGELRNLDLDAIGAQLGHKDLAGLRAAMRASDQGPAKIEWETIEEALQGWHYHPDQIERIKDGIRFEWDTFFKDVAVKLELSPRESLRLQAIISTTARERGMVPAEYLSQVMAHNAGRVGFKRGVEGLPESLRPTVELLRSAMIGTERERVKTLVNAVYTHLDRSAQQALLEEFQIDIGARIQGAKAAGRTVEAQELDLIAEELRGGWGPAADDAFADRILDRMGGKAAVESNLPTHELDAAGDTRARFVQPAELDELQTLGQGIVTDFRSGAREALPWLDEAPPVVAPTANAAQDAQNMAQELGVKWFNSEAKNALNAERDLMKMEKVGLDIGGAEDALNEYRAISKSDFTAAEYGNREAAMEAYQEERMSAWEHFTEEMEGAEFIGPEGLVAPAAPAVEFARFGKDARGNAVVPKAFKSEPGYVYRTVSEGRASSDWRVGEYAAGHPATIYADSDSSVVLRVRQSEGFDPATGGVNASDNMRARVAIPSDRVEVLRADGTWSPAAAPAVAPTVADTVFDDIYGSVKTGPYGGGTYDAHTGAALAVVDTIRPLDPTKPYLYHGTMPSVMAGIASVGVRPGSNWAKIETAKSFAFGKDAPIYRSQADRIGGISREQGKTGTWLEGRLVRPGDMEVSVDGGMTWKPVAEGPYSGAVGSRGQFSIPITEAGDEVAVREAFDEFVKANKDELELPGAQIGVFRNEETGLIEFDVALTVKTEREAEAVQLAVTDEQTGGWYNHAAGPEGAGIFRPAVRPVKPDVERAVQYVSQWAKKVYLPQMVADRPMVGRGLANLVDNVPTGDAFAYNKTQGMALDLMRQQMNGVVMDSHRLADMSKSRSVFMRSLNHPLFGLYPASYMWGKVVPEFVRFMAQTPFGLRTGAMTYAMSDIQMSLAAQYELDPAFQQKVEDIGDSESAFFLSYMLPSFPWEDIAAGVAPGLRSFARSGLTSEVVTRQLDMMSPDRWISSPAGALGELGDALRGVTPAAAPPPPPPVATLNSPAGQLKGPLGESQNDLRDVLRRVLTGQQ